MAIAASAKPKPIVSPNPGLPFVDPQTGDLTNSSKIALQQIRNYIVNMSRVIPCDASTTSNVITLTMLEVQPLVTQYASYDSYAFVADVTSTGNLTALVVTAQGNLATLNVYKAQGAAIATTGDVVAGSQYFLTYADSLNSSAGGFVLR